MTTRCLAGAVALLLAVSSPTAAGQTSPDADVAEGVRLLREGDLDGGLASLDRAVRRLSADPGRRADLAQAYYHQAVAYTLLDWDKAAVAAFREAIKLDPALRPDPRESPAKVLKAFQRAVEEAAVRVPSPTPSPSTEPRAPRAGGRGWLGVRIQPLTADLAQSFGLKQAQGALVSDVTAGSPAGRAGLQPDDVILGLDGREIEDNAALSRQIAAFAPGTTVRLRIRRGGSETVVRVQLGSFPEQEEGVGGKTVIERAGVTVGPVDVSEAMKLKLPPGVRGVVVLALEKGKPAEQAGLQQNDVIVGLDGNAVVGPAWFLERIERAEKLVRLRVRRGDGYFIVILKVA